MSTTNARGAARQSFPWQCRYCARPVTIEILERWEVLPGQDDDWEPHRWTQGRCEGCQSPFLFYEEADYDPESGPWGPLTQEWPETARSLPPAVPKPLRDSYDEAQRCMSVNAHTAAALIARRVVEGICAEHSAKGRTLAAKLDDLKARQVLDARLHEWSSLVKDIGNEGAHETTGLVTRRDAQEVLKFVEALLDYLYVFRERYDAFKRSRDQRKAGSTTVKAGGVTFAQVDEPEA